MPPFDLPLRCRCGKLEGAAVGVAAENGNRLLCFCDDCQVYARHLGTEGIVDARGATDLFQTAPARIRLGAGREHLRCVRLSEKGLLRWYAGCCRTPIGNTLASPRVPFIGLTMPFVAAGAAERDAALGPPTALLFGRFAVGGAPPGAPAKAPSRLVLRSARLLLGAWLRGESRPHPFFDASGTPLAAPHVLSPTEREELRR
jgi:hypothetical protein